MRQDFIRRGYRWPACCFLPAPLVGAGLGKELAVDVSAALISTATMLATLAAAWTPGRIAVRFDDDVAPALIDTPMEASIPTEALHRLPAWGPYVDCPPLGAGVGFLMTLDTGTVSAPGGQGYTELDELLVVVRGDDRTGTPHDNEIALTNMNAHEDCSRVGRASAAVIPTNPPTRTADGPVNATGRRCAGSD